MKHGAMQHVQQKHGALYETGEKAGFIFLHFASNAIEKLKCP